MLDSILYERFLFSSPDWGEEESHVVFMAGDRNKPAKERCRGSWPCFHLGHGLRDCSLSSSSIFCTLEKLEGDSDRTVVSVAIYCFNFVLPAISERADG